MAVLSERALEQVVLRTTTSDVDGNQQLDNELPAGFGDCIILNVFVDISGVATSVASPETLGPLVRLISPSGTPTQMIGSEYWRSTSSGAGLGFGAMVDPEQPVFWRAAESLRVQFLEVDTNATPTADASVYVLVRRLRQLGPVPRDTRGLQLTS